MSEQVLTTVALALAGLVGSALLVMWSFATHFKYLARAQERTTQIVARQDRALQRLAARLGVPLEPGRIVEIPWDGGTWPTASTMRCTSGMLEVRVTFSLDSDSENAECWYLPSVTIEIPQGWRWVVEPTGRHLVKRIFGDEVRRRSAAGRRAADFQRAFGVPEQAVPVAAREMLWSVGERSHALKFSARGLEIAVRPADLVAHKSFLQTVWEGGYDVDELSAVLNQACALAGTLIVT